MAAQASRRRRQPAGSRRPLFSFTRLPPSQWRSVRITNAIERLHEEFKRRIKTQTILPSADTAAMLFWALLQPIDLAA
jgi:putative transposase